MMKTGEIILILIATLLLVTYIVLMAMIVVYWTFDYSIGPKFATVHFKNGLGNQLFQLATLVGYAESRNLEPVVDTWKIHLDCYMHSSKLYFGDWMHGIAKKSLLMYNSTDINEADLFSYKQLREPQPNHVPILNGYFQSIHYLPSKETIQKYIYPSDKILEVVHEKYQSIIDNEALCLHIRRGDYTSSGDLWLVDRNEKYYIQALEQFLIDNPDISRPYPVCVFSNDIEWTKYYIASIPNIQDDYTFYYISDSDRVELALMTLLPYHIISNSTFSWWGAYLSNSRYVMAPHPWIAITDSREMYPSTWHTLSV